MHFVGVPLPPGFQPMDVAVATNGNAYITARIPFIQAKLFMWQGGANWLDTGQTFGSARIAGGPDGGVYFIGSVEGGVHFWKPNGGHQGGTPGPNKEHVIDITAGTDGHPWVAYERPPLVRDVIARWNGHAFDMSVEFSNLKRIASRNDQVWLSTSFDNDSGDPINTSWWWNEVVHSGNAYAQDLAVAPDGEIWHIGRDRRIYRGNENHWTPVDGSGFNLAVGPGSNCWVIGGDVGNELWRSID